TTRTSCSLPRPSWWSSSRPSVSSRHGRRPRASPSTRPSRSSRPRSPPGTEPTMTGHPPGRPAATIPDRDTAVVPRGHYLIGSAAHYAAQRPVRRVDVEAFRLDVHAVTTSQYRLYAEETGYVTLAERPLSPPDFPGAPPENLVPGSLVFTRTRGPVDLRHLSQ